MKMCWVAVAFVLLLQFYGGWCCRGHERNSLMRFNASVLDESNQVLNSWHGFNCCEWNGIQCLPHTHHVIRLDLHSSPDASIDGMSLSNLTGDVFSPLFNLEQLEHLDLSWNNFYEVPIPLGLGRIKSLRYLNLSCARFAGDIPRELGNISTLHYLDLSYNAFWRIVDMSTWTRNMRDLKELILDGVEMEGVESDDLERALSTMYSLIRLHLSGCVLYVAIPPSLANLTNITELQLGGNNFNGSIPSALLSLPRLQEVDLSGSNELGGKLSSILPQQSVSLHTLDLSYTSVVGSILDSVGNISSLSVLYLYNCHVESLPINPAMRSMALGMVKGASSML